MDESLVLIAVLECIGECYMSTSVDKVVNLKEYYTFVVNDCLCMAFRMFNYVC